MYVTTCHSKHYEMRILTFLVVSNGLSVNSLWWFVSLFFLKSLFSVMPLVFFKSLLNISYRSLSVLF